MLSIDDVHYQYPGFEPTLRGVDLEVRDGESAFLLGASGCGKTTLLRIVAGFLQPQKGRVSLDGRDLRSVPPHDRHAGFLFQEPALFPHLDVVRNVAFGLRYQGVPRKQELVVALESLQLVGLEHKADQPVDALSGGQRQRVALARTLAARPRCVLLDEPLSALDEPLRIDLGTRIKKLLAEREIPALWVTHDRGEAERLGDHVWVMEDGRAKPKLE